MNEKIQREIKEKISEIEEKSADEDYIYRGESKHYEKISSTLYREHADLEFENVDLSIIEQEMLNTAKKHMGHPQQELAVDFAKLVGQDDSETEFELLTEIQHYGGRTNLIDFTTDYLIALFFACDGHHDKDGRIILQKTEEIKHMISHPRNPRHRVIAQKSVFVRPTEGFIEPHEKDIVSIPAYLKQPLLEHLRKYHSVSTEAIYNDIYGFIRNQSIHRNAYTEFFRGFAHQDRGGKATTPAEKQKEYKKSIEHYDKAIELNSELDLAYSNRGEALLHLRKWKEAKADLITAKGMGMNIIRSFRNDYASIEDFKDRNGVELPKGIAELLIST